MTTEDVKAADVKADAAYMLEAEHIGIPGKVKDISVNIKEGELLGFAGLLGSGRTETAEMLFGAEKTAKGSIRKKGFISGMLYRPELP